MTPEVIVTLAIGIPTLLVASVGLYLQWALRPSPARGKFEPLNHIPCSLLLHTSDVPVASAIPNQVTGDEEQLAHELTGFLDQPGLYELPGDLPISTGAHSNIPFHQTTSMEYPIATL